MLLLAHEMPATVEIVDANDAILSRMAATLRHLDEERAELTLCSDAPLPCLHWGSHTRLHITDGDKKYSVVGTIIQHHLPEVAEQETKTGLSESLTVRVWECLTEEERRSLPRRARRFPVHFCMPEDRVPAGAEEGIPKEQWREGWSVDIGGGGIRFRTQYSAPFPNHILIQFTLPCDAPAIAGSREYRQKFCLQGRVLRTAPCGRHAEDQEVAVHFERLTVAEGCALAAYLSA